ncbi:hypothetical protein U5N25_03615 [Exiguobacterium indicum]|uniref:hypothetical protein n=1 Tax=Exiguobacterium indicum TaxID=296995 RepID=UPI00397BC1A0
MIYTKEIETDFLNLNKVLIEKFGGEEIFRKRVFMLKNYHSKVFLIKDLLNDIKTSLRSETFKAYEMAVEDLLDFIWLAYLGRYKSAIACLRTSLDIFVRGCYRELIGKGEKDSFSNNVDIVLKSVKQRFEGNLSDRLKKKAHSNFIEENFNLPIKRNYWDLSDSIHGKEIISLPLIQYVNEILDVNSNFDESSFNAVIDLGNNAIQKLFDLFLLINIEKLNLLVSSYKLTISIQQYSEMTKKYLSDFLIIHTFD